MAPEDCIVFFFFLPETKQYNMLFIGQLLDDWTSLCKHSGLFSAV